MGLDGVEIFTNSSASHHELRKLYTRVELIKEATLKVNFRRYAKRESFCLLTRLLSSEVSTFMPTSKVATETDYTMMVPL